jgi:hypothetical protein
MTQYKIQDEKELNFVWRNNGLLPAGGGERIEVRDAIATPNASVWLPKVFSNIVKEAVEPLLVGASLLQRVQWQGGQTITFPAVGALDAADVAEGQAYPERQLQMGGATVTASIGKSGLAVKFTDEMLKQSQFDVMNMHLRAAGRALARHKEKKIFNFISAMGTTAFDNLNPTTSINGVTHGRALDGSANGSCIVDDIFDCYCQNLLQGFTPNTLLMHPLSWAMFIKDPILRTIALMSGGNTFFATASGKPSDRAPWDNSSQGGMGVSGGQNIVPGGNAGSETATALTGYPQTLTSAPQLPSYFPFPFRIIVSPFVRFNPSTKLTDIFMFDSNELGALLVAEDITTEEWRDISVDITKVKLRERYGIGILHEGQAITVMRNVKVIPNEIVLPAQASINVSGSITAITATTPVV